VAKALGVHSRRVERWRSRFSKSGLAGLEDRHRSGRKAKFSAVARCEIITVACDPVITDKGKTSRTIENVMLQAIERGVVEEISWTSVQRILAEGEVRPHKVEGWLHSTDPFFRERVKEIVELYLPVGSVVLCVDEKPGMQALERRYPDRPAKPGKLRRREYEYKRHGTQTLLCAFEVHKGRVLAQCGDTRKATDLVRFMEEVAVQYPTGGDDLSKPRASDRPLAGRFAPEGAPNDRVSAIEIPLFSEIVSREEYKTEQPNGYQYSQFCDRCARWAARVNVVMRQEHRAGHQVAIFQGLHSSLQRFARASHEGLTSTVFWSRPARRERSSD